MLSTLGRVRENIIRIITIVIKNEQVEGLNANTIKEIQENEIKTKETPKATMTDSTDSKQETKPKSDQYLQGAYDKRTQPIKATGTYLDNQEQTIRTALGLDFPTATTAGKIFRILQFISQVLIGIGTLLMFWKWKKIPLEYKALVVTSFGILLACLFLPYVSTTVSATRFYQVALFFLAPAFALGLEWVFRKQVLIAIIFLAYFAFTSGLVFEAIQETKIDVVNIPYSLALSDKRMNINGLYTADDIAVAKWLSLDAQQSMSKYSDQNGIQLMLEYRNTGIAYLTLEKPYYVFSTTWSTQHNTFVAAKVPGLRMYKPIPEEMKAEVVYRQGDAIVYKVTK
jgi:energy-converting hydrogenase Eha subunit A